LAITKENIKTLWELLALNISTQDRKEIKLEE